VALSHEHIENITPQRGREEDEDKERRDSEVKSRKQKDREPR